MKFLIDTGLICDRGAKVFGGGLIGDRGLIEVVNFIMGVNRHIAAFLFIESESIALGDDFCGREESLHGFSSLCEEDSYGRKKKFCNAYGALQGAVGHIW